MRHIQEVQQVCKNLRAVIFKIYEIEGSVSFIIWFFSLFFKATCFFFFNYLLARQGKFFNIIKYSLHGQFENNSEYIS